MKRATIGLITLLWLPGCSTTGSNFAACKVTAPALVNYSAKTETAAAAEVLGGSCPVMAGMLADCAVMRDQTRLLLKAK